MRRAIFPGTFDPFTIGHYSVVKRALTFMDEVVIGIGINENKKTWFPTEKRVEMIEKLFADDPRVKVDAYDCLTIDFARAKEAQFIVVYGAGTNLYQLYDCKRIVAVWQRCDAILA